MKKNITSFKKNIQFWWEERELCPVDRGSFLKVPELVFLSVVLVLSLSLFLSNLGNIYLWQDEAQTALLAKTILQFGFPKGYDGVNFFSQELGAEYGKEYIWKWHPWFPFYLLALVFKVFGVSTFTARLPFALFGILTIFLLYFFTRSLLKNRTVAGISTMLLLFMVPFILLSRQSRYYSVATFFSVGGLYGYWAMMQGRRFAPFLFLVSSTLLFHTHYIYFATLLFTVSLYTLLFYRNTWRTAFAWTLAVILLNSPWIVWFSTMKYSDQYQTKVFEVGQFLTWLYSYLVPINTYVFPAFILLLLLPGFFWNFFKKGVFVFFEDEDTMKRILLPGLFVIVTISAISVVGSAPFFRFLAPTLPLFALLSGVILAELLRFNFFLGSVCVVALIVRGPLPDLAYELTHDYDGPIEGIVGYLQKNGSPEDVVAITYGDFPVKFYTGLRVVGGLTGENLASAKRADWVIVRKNVICEKDFAVRNFLLKNVRWENYSRVELPYPDLPFENRESPGEHLYKTKTGYPGVLLFKKRE